MKYSIYASEITRNGLWLHYLIATLCNVGDAIMLARKLPMLSSVIDTTNGRVLWSK